MSPDRRISSNHSAVITVPLVNDLMGSPYHNSIASAMEQMPEVLDRPWSKEKRPATSAGKVYDHRLKEAHEFHPS